MALIKCPECGKKLSEFADKCPECGCPMNKIKSINREIEYNKDFHEGDVIEFGRYYYDDKKSLKPIKWIIMSIENNKMSLISEYVIDAMPYNNLPKSVTWAECSLRFWLNNDFKKTAFNSNETKLLLSSVVKTDGFKNSLVMKNSILGPRPSIGGEAIKDFVTLLSFEEAKKYFKFDYCYESSVFLTNYLEMLTRNFDGMVSSDEFMDDYFVMSGCGARATPYAKSKNVFCPEDIKNDGTGTSYWLRSPGYTNKFASCTLQGSFLNHIGEQVSDNTTGVRPVILIKYLSKEEFNKIKKKA